MDGGICIRDEPNSRCCGVEATDNLPFTSRVLAMARSDFHSPTSAARHLSPSCFGGNKTLMDFADKQIKWGANERGGRLRARGAGKARTPLQSSLSWCPIMGR